MKKSVGRLFLYKNFFRLLHNHQNVGTGILKIMSNKFEGLFRTNHETTGPSEKETIPVELKRSAVEAVVAANIIEPQAFQLGAVKMADIILQSEQQGLSRHWMHWLDEKDVMELEKTLFNMKNKVHAQHQINPNPKKARPKERMYELFKAYALRGSDVLGFIEHHLGHSLDTTDVREILGWIDERRSSMTPQNSQYREILKMGDPLRAQRELEAMYKTLYTDFLQSSLYQNKVSKINDFYRNVTRDNDFNRKIFDAALRNFFFKTFEED